MISINWDTKIITVPQSYLTNLGNSIYELDVNQFRLDLDNLEDDEAGIIFDKTHNHNTALTLSGTTYARSLEIINGYKVEFENGSYTVKCSGANHNIGDVKTVNSVSLIIGNSSGLISVATGSGVTEQDKADIIQGVLDEVLTGHTGANSLGKVVKDLETTAAKIRSGVNALQ